MTLVTSTFQDWAAVGVKAPDEGTVIFQPYRPVLDATTGVVTTSAQVQLPLVDGVASRVFDPTPAGEAVAITVVNLAFPQGPYYVTIPDVVSITLVELIRDHQVDPVSLQPSPAGQAAWDAVLAQVQAMADQVAAATVTAIIDPSDPDILLLSFPSFQTDPDDGLILVVPIGA